LKAVIFDQTRMSALLKDVACSEWFLSPYSIAEAATHKRNVLVWRI
jgi:hypothetical protein